MASKYLNYFEIGGSMKKLVLILSMLVIFLPCAMLAKERSLGLGVIVGEPTGLSFKKWIGKNAAIDAAAAWSFIEDTFHVHADYLWHNSNLFKAEKGRLLFYFGVGGRISTEAEFRVGARVPVGLNYNFENSPLEVFAEIGPVLDLTPATEFKFTGGVGIRYFF